MLKIICKTLLPTTTTQGSMILYFGQKQALWHTISFDVKLFRIFIEITLFFILFESFGWWNTYFNRIFDTYLRASMGNYKYKINFRLQGTRKTNTETTRILFLEMVLSRCNMINKWILINDRQNRYFVLFHINSSFSLHSGISFWEMCVYNINLLVFHLSINILLAARMGYLNVS